MFENHQKLYKVSASTGKVQLWFGWSIGDYVCCSYGQLDGKLQKSAYQTEGKNIGRSNETTGAEQAVIEMQAMYKDQMDNKHYFTSEIEAHEKAAVCRIPRKVHNYKNKKDKWENKKMLSSTKFNGGRACIVSCDLYSKIGRKEDIKVDRLREDLNTFRTQSVLKPNFDCEVYAHGLSLQRIRSAWLKPIKTEKEIIKIATSRARMLGKPNKYKTVQEAIEYLGYNPNEDTEKLKFYVFDIPDDTGTTFLERVEWLQELQNEIKALGLEESFEVEIPQLTENNDARLVLRNNVCLQGYEGLVHYDLDGVYEYGKRSSNTLKDKPRYDAECLVVDVTKDKSGDGVLSCIASDILEKAKFKCKMKVERRDGNRYERDYKSMLELKDKWITFSYEELSDKGIPTKPVGELERECDDQGRPLE